MQKLTGIWLKGLPVLEQGEWVKPHIVHTKRKCKRNGTRHAVSKWYADSASLAKEERTRVRSKTFEGVARAMAMQWAGKCTAPIAPAQI